MNKISRRSHTILWLSFLCLFFTKISYASNYKENIYEAGIQSYLYAYPLVVSEVTKRVMTNLPSPQKNGRAPINQFSHAEKFASPVNKDITRPNCDTLYSIGWMDLSTEPLVLSLPDTNDRYYLIPIVDAWTDIVASLGKRTTGTKAQNFVIVGPHWKGELPKELPIVKLDTSFAWIAGRTLAKGEDDYPFVHKIQEGYKLTPLSQWGKDYTPPSNLPTNPNIDMQTPPLEQVDKMDVETFFSLFAKLLKDNPPREADKPILAKLNAIGIIPGEDFNIAKLSRAEVLELQRAATRALKELKHNVFRLQIQNNGWVIPPISGSYGTNYLARASMAYTGGIGANLPEDALYATTFQDSERKVLNGKNNYVLHFSRWQIPPANGFWSVSLYGTDGFLVANSINRYTLGDRSPMVYNRDGSLDIYIQHDSPGRQKESNWLPTPDENFNLLMRLYWPKARVTKGLWHPSDVVKVK